MSFMKSVVFLILSLLVPIIGCSDPSTESIKGKRLYTKAVLSSGDKTYGRVLNVVDDSPIKGVVVVALWKIDHPTLHGTHIECLHAASTYTNARGKWKIPKRSYSEFPSNEERRFMSYYIYKPGYKSPNSERGYFMHKGNIFENVSPKKYYSVLLYDSNEWVNVKSINSAKRMVGYGNAYLIPTARPSFKEIRTMVNSVRCEAKDGTDKALLPYYHAIRSDLERHASQEDELTLLKKVDKIISEITNPKS